MSDQHKSWFKFLLSKTLLKQFLVISVFAGMLLLGVLFYLKLYTNHNNTIELPDYTGVYIDDVDSLLKEQCLRLSLIHI